MHETKSCSEIIDKFKDLIFTIDTTEFRLKPKSYLVDGKYEFPD